MYMYVWELHHKHCHFIHVIAKSGVAIGICITICIAFVLTCFNPSQEYYNQHSNIAICNNSPRSLRLTCILWRPKASHLCCTCMMYDVCTQKYGSATLTIFMYKQSTNQTAQLFLQQSTQLIHISINTTQSLWCASYTCITCKFQQKNPTKYRNHWYKSTQQDCKNPHWHTGKGKLLCLR